MKFQPGVFDDIDTARPKYQRNTSAGGEDRTYTLSVVV